MAGSRKRPAMRTPQTISWKMPTTSSRLLRERTAPAPQDLSSNAERIVAVAKTIGAIPLVLDYREHDKVVAAISHLPIW